MPQIAANYPNLNQIFGSNSVFPVEYGMQQFNTAQQADQLNQAQALQDVLYNQQANPLRLDQVRLNNQTLEAQLPGAQAQSSLMQDKAGISRNTLDEQTKASRGKLLADISDDDLKVVENSAQQMAMSRNPQERLLGEQLLRQHKSIIQDRAKQEAQGQRMLEQIYAQGNEARKTQQQAIDAGKYNRVAGGNGLQNQLEKALVSGSWDKAATAYDYMAQQAQAGGDMESAQYYQTKAKEYGDKYLQSRYSQKPGGVDVGAVAGLPTTAQPVTPTPKLPGQQAESSIPKELPSGTKSNGDGTFTLPDGTRIRKKQ